MGESLCHYEHCVPFTCVPNEIGSIYVPERPVLSVTDPSHCSIAATFLFNLYHVR